jgi:carbon-monoxide dehydrogenase large subunit
MGTRFIGERIRRREDPRLLMGQGRFVADVAAPGVLHAAILRSPHAHARIGRIDLAAARRAPGVASAVAAEDLGAANAPFPLLVPNPALKAFMPRALATEVVRYVGEPVAAVVAETRYAAEDALERIRAEYEPLPAALGPRAALDPGAPLVHAEGGTNLACRLVQRVGDVEAAFRAADRVFREHLFVSRGGGAPLEARGLLAVPEGRDGRLTLWASTQVPHLLRQVLAQLLGRAEHTIRVVAPDVGGGFGPKAMAYPEDLLVPWLALRLGRPVRWMEDRTEDFLSTVQERDQFHEVEVAVRADGTILGVRDRFLADAGAYVPWGVVVPYLTATTLPGPYKVPNYEVEMTIAYTHRVPVAVVRGAGRPQAVYVMERMMDRIAEGLGLDPAEVRLRNFIQPDEFPYNVGLVFRDGSPLVYDSGNYPGCLRKLLEMADYHAFRETQARLRAQGRYLGLGIACYVEGTGLGPFEGASIRVDTQGTVQLITGACPQGQGHETTLAQLCAETIGVPIEDVIVVTGDTEAIPFGIGTFASRVAAVASGAVVEAGRQVRQRAIRLAAQLLEAPAEDVLLEEGRLFVRGAPGRALRLGEVAAASLGRPGFTMREAHEPGLQATRYFHPSASAYSNGANVAIVEVDPETGGVSLLRYLVVHDCGRVINPLLVDGQVVGGVAHGIGNALFEDVPFAANGQPLAITFMDYLLPTAAEIPLLEVEHIETPTPLNPAGVKGAGESGTIPAPAAIAAAVEDALAPFGVRVGSLPLSPEKIRALVAAAPSRGPESRVPSPESTTRPATRDP